MEHFERLRRTLYDLSTTIHEARNNADYREAEKMQLRIAYDKLTTRMVLFQQFAHKLSDPPADQCKSAEEQARQAMSLLSAAAMQDERRTAIAETFEVFPLLDVLLPKEARPYLS